MDIQDFIENFSEQFDGINPSEVRPDTNFKELEEWSSLTVLLIIAMADDRYNVRLSGNDIHNSTTVEDLYNIINNKEHV